MKYKVIVYSLALAIGIVLGLALTNGANALHVADTGYNSASDVLQTAAGVYVYQRADYGTEFVQGGDDNTDYRLQGSTYRVQ